LKRLNQAFTRSAWQESDENPETFKKYFWPALLDAVEKTPKDVSSDVVSTLMRGADQILEHEQASKAL